MKIRSLGVEFFRADGRTDMAKIKLDLKETKWEKVGPIRFIWLKIATRDRLT